MKNDSPYTLIVEWSDEDGCYVDRCPELFYGGCHGDNEQQVRAELRQIVEEWLEIREQGAKRRGEY